MSTCVVQRSKANSMSFVKNQGEHGRANTAKPEVADPRITYAIRFCRPNPEPKDPTSMLISGPPGALRICTPHDCIEHIIPSPPEFGIECLIAFCQNRLIQRASRPKLIRSQIVRGST